MTRTDKELAELAALSLNELREQWTELTSSAAPAALTAPLLRRFVAQQVQERRFGRLPALVLRELERTASGEGPTSGPIPRPALTPGTRLFREWQGRTIAVEVREDGFAWDGNTWGSLSEIARTVTGAQWSGPRFFGLRRGG